ncbi:Obg family GTPase CgtA [Rubellicoccus peritrichatus]|uniref:GTPase Obg n=1 Tax=Rubellicoccus peritrichatus TaxID=3080537 RepID=A0AAQ3QTL7_9BACT|nr:GTPase ObgE [Puniceicoccus sp. CR14]WOO39513.1 GTPase ObgE [Puniceicoccus sp. CR14]
MFVDEVSVSLKAGDGGNGCVSFRRERHRPKGGPDGGNGARGGSVILVCDQNIDDLTDYKYVPHARADNGEPGRGNDQNGKAGKDKRLLVPPGLVVIDEETGEVVTELLDLETEYVLLKGGTGGKGNASFKSSVDQAPRKFTAGTEGEEGSYKFVLKTIADAGLVGLPNAGKSTLTNRLTKARPKMGAYPFTTLQPSVGILDYPEEHARASIADIPGLIAGAHKNKGLGHRFLRHIERCNHLLLIIDFAGVDGRSPTDDYKTLINELGEYDPALLEKPRTVLANKIDLPAATDNLNAFRAEFPDIEAMPMSCQNGEGLEQLKQHLRPLAKLLK